MTENVYNGTDLEQALSDGSLEKRTIEMIGMVKPSSSDGYIAFARGNCDTWVDLPVSLIAEAVQLGRRPCKNHTHPLFHIRLDEPTDATAKVLASLLLVSPDGPGGFLPEPAFSTEAPPAGLSQRPSVYSDPTASPYEYAPAHSYPGASMMLPPGASVPFQVNPGDYGGGGIPWPQTYRMCYRCYRYRGGVTRCFWIRC
jgi:hypothetical protein